MYSNYNNGTTEVVVCLQRSILLEQRDHAKIAHTCISKCERGTGSTLYIVKELFSCGGEKFDFLCYSLWPKRITCFMSHRDNFLQVRKFRV